MTATEVLRRMLDERGVEWKAWDGVHPITVWHDETYLYEFVEYRLVNGAKQVSGCLSDNDGHCELTIKVFNCTPEQAIAATLGQKVTGNTSDGYHTFNELYHHRAVLFSVIVRDHRELAWKSMRHHDGTMYDGMFIVGIETPEGQATYHYDIDPYWDMFNCKELDQAPEWDGHTPSEAIERIATLGSCNCPNNCTNGERTETCHPVISDNLNESEGMGDAWADCSECGHLLFVLTDPNSEPPNYCPECGARVVEPTTNDVDAEVDE